MVVGKGDLILQLKTAIPNHFFLPRAGSLSRRSVGVLCGRLSVAPWSWNGTNGKVMLGSSFTAAVNLQWAAKSFWDPVGPTE